jgi:Matrixin
VWPIQNSHLDSDRTRVKKFVVLVAAALFVAAARGQSILRLKTKQTVIANSTPVSVIAHTRTPARLHWIVQFLNAPGRTELVELERRGIRVLSYIPDNAVSVAARAGAVWDGLGAQWIGQLEPEEKISPLLASAFEAGGSSAAVVEAYSDVDLNDVRAIASQAGVVIQENPDLLANHLLVTVDARQALALASWDEIAYIFPASPKLLTGSPVVACSDPLTSLGHVGQSIAVIGGWDGTEHGSASLKYSFVQVTDKVPVDSAESEIERALAQWAQYVMVSFTPSSDPTGDETLAILFASGAHGDGYPFTSGVVAHTFYPFPNNPEPIAGDMHFNEDQNWKIGSGVDIYSVALHEAGHALGLGHSDSPDAVMYPYYQMHTVLQPADIAAIRELYATRGASQPSSPDTPPPTTPTPTTPDPSTPAPSTPAPSNTLLLVVQAPAASTPASSISMTGALSGGVGAVSLSWSTNQGFAGTAVGSATWTIPAVPLNAGANVITITARDSQLNQATQSVTVTRQQTTPPPSNPPTPAPSPSPGPPDTTPPALTIVSPASNTVSTSASSIVVSGSASDNVGVAKVTWTASTGTSGTATGTTNWSTSAIPLYVGTTTIVITASDAAGNSSWRSVVVTRN